MEWLKGICYAITIVLAIYGFILCRKMDRILKEAQQELDKVKEEAEDDS